VPDPTTEPTAAPTTSPATAPAAGTPTNPSPDPPPASSVDSAPTVSPAAAQPAPLMPAAPHVRIVVERADDPRCGIRVGDSVDVAGPGLSTGGKPFCPKALMAAVPVLGMRQGMLPADDWLFRKPFVCCPDARENVVLRLEAM